MPVSGFCTRHCWKISVYMDIQCLVKGLREPILVHVITGQVAVYLSTAASYLNLSVQALNFFICDLAFTV